MRKSYLSAAAFWLFGCQKAETKKECTPEQHRFSFQSGKSLDTVRREKFTGGGTLSFYVVKAGNSEVFTYEKINQDCPEYIDDEGSVDVVFQVPQGTTAFVAADSAALSQMKTGLQINCGECNIGLLPLFKGRLEGNQLNAETWHIKASLLPRNGSAPIAFESNFTRR